MLESNPIFQKLFFLLFQNTHKCDRIFWTVKWNMNWLCFNWRRSLLFSSLVATPRGVKNWKSKEFSIWKQFRIDYHSFFFRDEIIQAVNSLLFFHQELPVGFQKCIIIPPHILIWGWKELWVWNIIVECMHMKESVTFGAVKIFFLNGIDVNVCCSKCQERIFWIALDRSRNLHIERFFPTFAV